MRTELPDPRSATSLSPSAMLRELAWPLTDRTVLIAFAAFALLALLARQAGLFGLWLGILLLPAAFRYLLSLLEARACGRSTPVAGIEMFSLVDNAWSLAAMSFIVLSLSAVVLLQQGISPAAAMALAVLLIIIVPAWLAVLALTRSPLQALNPLVLLRLIRACGPGYSVIPVAVLLLIVVARVLGAEGVPGFVVLLVGSYAVVLLFTLTGAVLFVNGLQGEVGIPDALEPGAASELERRGRARQQVLTHAYGFFSRGNAAGGLAHIRDALQEEGDSDEAWRWYIGEMNAWESRDAALMLAQAFLTRLLQLEREVEAVKLISRCLLEDERFRPLPDDRDAARAAALRLDRADLVRLLDS